MKVNSAEFLLVETSKVSDLVFVNAIFTIGVSSSDMSFYEYNLKKRRLT